MKKIRLDDEEKSTLAAFEKGHLKPIANSKKEVVRITRIVKTAGNKNRWVSLRMQGWDFLRAKELALQEGLPYQTLLSSILHKYFSGKLTEAN